MKILLAGPGTGKTFKIRSLIEKKNASNVLILSFTNATIKDLNTKLQDIGVSEKNCMTLHKFAIKYNHDRSRHVLVENEIQIIQQIAKQCTLQFDKLCDFLGCTTFDQMIDRFVSYSKVIVLI